MVCSVEAALPRKWIVLPNYEPEERRLHLFENGAMEFLPPGHKPEVGEDPGVSEFAPAIANCLAKKVPHPTDRKEKGAYAEELPFITRENRVPRIIQGAGLAIVALVALAALLSVWPYLGPERYEFAPGDDDALTMRHVTAWLSSESYVCRYSHEDREWKYWTGHIWQTLPSGDLPAENFLGWQKDGGTIEAPSGRPR